MSRPSSEELEAYCGRLRDVLDAGGALRLVQIYTVARRPAEDYVQPLADDEVDAVAALVRERTGLEVAAYYGTSDY